MSAQSRQDRIHAMIKDMMENEGMSLEKAITALRREVKESSR